MPDQFSAGNRTGTATAAQSHATTPANPAPRSTSGSQNSAVYHSDHPISGGDEQTAIHFAQTSTVQQDRQDGSVAVLRNIRV